MIPHTQKIDASVAFFAVTRVIVIKGVLLSLPGLSSFYDHHKQRTLSFKFLEW